MQDSDLMANRLILQMPIVATGVVRWRISGKFRSGSSQAQKRPAQVASTQQDCGAERRIVAPITRTRLRGRPP